MRPQVPGKPACTDSRCFRYLEIMAELSAEQRQADAVAVQRRWRDLSVHTYARIVIISALFYYLFHREIGGIVTRWLTDSNWSHGLLIPVFSLYLLNQHKDEILRLRPRPNYLGLVFLICAILFYVFNVVSPSGYGYFRPLSIIATMGVVVLLLGGWGLLRYAWMPVLFLIFAIPLPESYLKSITMPMQQWAASAAAVVLDMVKGLDATANGVIIDVVYKGHRLEPGLSVEEACSGIRLLTAFLALGVLMAYLHERPIWQRMVLLASTAPIAIVCNIVRVTITGFIYIFLDPQYAQGIYHDMLGLAMLPLAFGLYWSLAWFLSNLFVEETESPAVVVRRNSPQVVRRRDKGQ